MSIFRKLSASLIGSGLLQAIIIALTGTLVSKYPDLAPIIASVGAAVSGASPSPLLTKKVP